MMNAHGLCGATCRTWCGGREAKVKELEAHGQGVLWRQMVERRCDKWQGSKCSHSSEVVAAGPQEGAMEALVASAATAASF